MNVSLNNVGWFLTDDCASFDGWTGISEGEIHVDGKIFGVYVAAWYPNLGRDLQLMITAYDGQPLKATLSVGLTCPVGNPSAIAPVSADQVPWSGDGVIFMDPTAPEEIEQYAIAKLAVRLAAEVLRLDSALLKYIQTPSLRIAGEGVQLTVQA